MGMLGRGKLDLKGNFKIIIYKKNEKNNFNISWNIISNFCIC
jgi:hypothetical protein